MDRRKAIGRIAGVSAAAASALPAAPASERQYYELRYFQLRNGVQNTMPTAKPAGLGTFGAFNPFIGENSPFLLLLLTYSSFAEAEHIDERLGAWAGYIRYERTLLRAFAGKPRLTLPPASKAGHLFELRTYESNNAATLRQKIEMFNGGEMQIFQRLGMNPVFFGEALVGQQTAAPDLHAGLRGSRGPRPHVESFRVGPGVAKAPVAARALRRRYCLQHQQHDSAADRLF